MKPIRTIATVQGALIGSVIALTAVAIVLAWVPPVSRDALTHHLAVPKLYLQQGGIHEIPSIVFSYYPMNLDLLYLVPLYFGNDILPKLIHFGFALLTAAFIFVYLRSRLDRVYALVGVVLFLSLPVVVKLSIQAYVDLGLICFSFGSIFFLLKWLEAPQRWSQLLLAAIFCGLALGTKYNALIVWVLLTMFILPAYLNEHRRAVRLAVGGGGGEKGPPLIKALGWTALFAIVALVVYSPWAVRNIIWKGNPIYPLYKNLLAEPSPDSEEGGQQETDDRWKTSKNPSGGRIGPLARRKILYDEAWWYTALMPLRIFFQGRDDDPKYFDGRLNPYLLILPVFAFGRRRASGSRLAREKMVFIWFVALYFLIAFFSVDMRIRYIAPMIPPLVVLAVLGLHDLVERLKRSRSPDLRKNGPLLAVGALVALLLMNGFYIVDQFNTVEPIGYISGRVSRDAYITRHRPEYPVIRFANVNLAQNSRILALFLGNRRYYSDREMDFRETLFEQSVLSATAAQDVVDALHQNGITHLMIRYDLFQQWVASAFDDHSRIIAAAFLRSRTRRLYSGGGYGLYEIQPLPEAS
jgi:4-amino-4-deoxy-L-arabinose transferase-like glycosyltransferase